MVVGASAAAAVDFTVPLLSLVSLLAVLAVSLRSGSSIHDPRNVAVASVAPPSKTAAKEAARAAGAEATASSSSPSSWTVGGGGGGGIPCEPTGQHGDEEDDAMLFRLSTRSFFLSFLILSFFSKRVIHV